MKRAIGIRVCTGNQAEEDDQSCHVRFVAVMWRLVCGANPYVSL